MPPKKNVALSVEQVVVDVDLAKELLGWREAKKGDVPAFRLNGENIVLANNRHNRPFSLGLAKKYSDQMFRGEWAGQWNSPSKTCNGETIILDAKGMIASAAHRLVGLILAETERQKVETMGQKDFLKEKGIKGPITFPTILVKGVDPTSADTNDTGKNRSLGDVLFRRDEFKGKELSDSARKRLSRELAVALRLVWLRLRGERVDRGTKLYHPEAVEFLEKHPLLHDAVLHVWNEEGGTGAEGKKISSYISLGYAAGLLYLSTHADSSRQDYEEGNLDMAAKTTLWDKAEKFWVLFGQDLHDKDNVIKWLHKALEKNQTSEAKYSRDALCTLVTRAWLVWTKVEKSKWGTQRAFSTGLTSKTEGGKEVLNFERFGGLDLDADLLKEAGYLDEAVLRREFSVGWKLSDLCWVDQPEVEPWFGEITGFSDDGKVATVKSQEEEQEYACELDWLCVDKPDREDEIEDAEVVEDEE
jgi:hypothetical protein